MTLHTLTFSLNLILTSLLHIFQELLKAEVESLKKDLSLRDVEKAELTRRLAEGDSKIVEEQTLHATAESLKEKAMNNLTWIQHQGIVRVSIPFLCRIFV